MKCDTVLPFGEMFGLNGVRTEQILIQPTMSGF